MMRVLSGLTVCKRFEAGCCTTKDHGAIAKLCALDRNIARRVPGMISLLERGVMLLINDNESESFKATKY